MRFRSPARPHAIALLWLVAFGLVAASPRAQAKQVKVEWKAVSKATKYELQIDSQGKEPILKTLPESTWTGELDPGLYFYQVRAYDRVNRAGKWSTPKPLAVMPPAPAPISPIDGKKIVFYNPKLGTTLHWNEVKGADRYHVVVKIDGKTVRDELVNGKELKLEPMASGKYAWQVTPVVIPDGRAPAFETGKKWEGKPSEEQEFRVDYKQLDAPSPVSPTGVQSPPSDNQLKFKWRTVDGAEAYRVEVFYRKNPKDKEPVPASITTVADNSAVINVTGEGFYSWRVRALANIEEPPAGKPGAEGPVSRAEFKLDRNARFFDGSGYVALSTMLAPYSYEVNSPSSSGTLKPIDSEAITFRLSGEYYVRPQWGLSAAAESTYFRLGDEVFIRKGFEALVKYRVTFGDPKSGWGFSPKIGLEERDYSEIILQKDSATGRTSFGSIQSMTFGPTAGFDLRKVLSPRFSVGIKFAYFLPSILVSDVAQSLTPEASRRNWSAGAQILYWLGPSWGLGAGAYVEKRSISYTTNLAAGAGKPESVKQDGSYFFGSLLYSFGR